MTSPPSGVVAFLMTDIEGSTRLWDSHPREMADALRVHDDIIRQAVRAHGGYVFTQAGDGFAVAFRTTSDAVAAALDTQLGLRAYGWPSETELRVRMSIHTGTATERDGDYFGPTVNRAARLLTIGNGGQVLLSAAAAEAATESLPAGVTFRSLGEHRLRDLSSPERIVELVHPQLPPLNMQLRSLNELPNNLPIELTSFVGREVELEQLEKLALTNRLVTVVGVGGAGKTRLALHVASQVLDDYPDGVWLVELATVSDRPEVIPTIASALGFSDSGDGPIQERLIRYLERRRLLILLDNCEHVVDTVAHVTRDILEECPGVNVLATSRELLGVPGEVPYQLRSMTVPTGRPEVSQLGEFDAVRLFIERAGAVRPGFRITDENAESVLSIIRRLDGIPLAIELAAARLKLLSPEQLSARLDDRFKLLAGGSRTALPRQQTLQAAIDWSYDLLDDAEKAMFRRLSVFQGGFTLEAVEAVCTDEELQALESFDLLARLVDKSLVMALESATGVRYRMLETLRQYALSKLVEIRRVDGFRRRHAHYYAGLVEEAIPHMRGPEEQLWLDRLEEEHDNFRQALRWAFDSGDAYLAQSMAAGLYRFWMYRLHFDEGRRWLEEALAVSSENTPARARALVAAATFAQFQGDTETADRRFAEGVGVLRTLDDPGFLFAGLNNWGTALIELGRFDQACCLFEEAERIFTSTEDAGARTYAVMNLAACTFMSGNSEEGLAHAERGLEIARRSGSAITLGTALSSLVSFLLQSGRVDDAIDRLNELEKIVEFDEVNPGELEGLRGWVAIESEQYSEARELLWSAILRAREIEGYEKMSGRFEGLVLSLAVVEAALGRLERAAVLVEGIEALMGSNRQPSPQQARWLERVNQAINANLDGESRAAATAKGRLLSLPGILDFALEDRLQAALRSRG